MPRPRDVRSTPATAQRGRARLARSLTPNARSSMYRRSGRSASSNGQPSAATRRRTSPMPTVKGVRSTLGHRHIPWRVPAASTPGRSTGVQRPGGRPRVNLPRPPSVRTAAIEIKRTIRLIPIRWMAAMPTSGARIHRWLSAGGGARWLPPNARRTDARTHRLRQAPRARRGFASQPGRAESELPVGRPGETAPLRPATATRSAPSPQISR
jgi:hypothetical protein